MKNLLPIILLMCFMSCKEECIDCIGWKMTNEAQAIKQCNGEDYDMSIFEEILVGTSEGYACDDNNEIRRIEGDTTYLSFEKCQGVNYESKLFAKCN